MAWIRVVLLWGSGVDGRALLVLEVRSGSFIGDASADLVSAYILQK